MKAAALLRDIGARVARGAFAASVVGLGAALLDAHWVRAANEEGAPSALGLALADAGVVAPFILLIGVFTAAFVAFLAPDFAPSPKTLVAELRILAFGRPADVAAFVPLAVLAAFFWTTLIAQVARALLAVEISAALAGMAIAASAVALAVLFALAALTLTPPLRRSLATASDRLRACVDPAATGAVAVGVAALLFSYGVATGTVSGEGGFFGIWGIFKRPELDLRGPTMLLVAMLAATFAPAFLPRFRGILAMLLALLPLGLTLRAATSLGDDADLAASIERSAPLGKPTLAVLRALTDRDHDGAAGLFGGGDCDDSRADIGPEGREIPGNGVDEDCSGSDLTTTAAAAPPAPTPTQNSGANDAKAKVPADLNIVLITVDTLRADVGFMGYDRAVTPNLDALAARSVVFERAYSLASYTGKSVGPMLIGKYGSETDRNWGHFNTFGDKDVFVSERLKKAGFFTMSVQAHHYFGDFGGLQRGFDVLDLSAGPPKDAPWDVDNEATSEKITNAAISELEKPQNVAGRFYLWVHYLDPHADYLRHEDGPSFGKSQRDLYDGEVAFTDKHIGRLLDAINNAPWGKKTAIFVTSDHGEAFGEHGMQRHGFELWEPLVRVPFIAHVPGIEPARVSQRRSLIDLVPTMLDVAQIALPPHASTNEGSDFVSGVSLLTNLVAPKQAAPRDVFIDMPAGPYNDARRALIHGDQKLIVSNNARFELYDLAADPGEKKNLMKSDAGPAMRALYDTWRAQLREVTVTGKRKQ